MVTYSVDGLINGDEITNIALTTIATETTDAGDYDISAIYDSHINYSISINTGTLTISPRVITIIITNNQLSNQTIEYGDELKLDKDSYKIKSGTILDIDKSDFSIDITSSPNPNNPETYLVAAICSNKNYSISLENNQITIVPRKLKLSIINQTFEYGEQILLDNTKYTIISGSFAYDHENSVRLSTTATNTSNIGNYPITLSFDNMEKYDLSITSGYVNISTRSITISTNQSKTYGEETELNNLNYVIEEGSIANNDNLELNLSTNATKTSTIGNYEITLISANKNYNVTLINSYLTINPKTIYITLTKQESVYGNIVEMDNTKFTMDETQLVEGSSLPITLQTNATNKSNVGSYKITASTTNENYELHYTPGTFEITKRKISIRVYDQTTPHTFTLIYNTEDYDIMAGSVVNGDELNIKLQTNATALSFAGDYELIATYNNDNYDITFTDATLTLEFSYVDALMIVVPTLVVILVASIILAVLIKRKNKTNPLYKKWTKSLKLKV